MKKSENALTEQQWKFLRDITNDNFLDKNSVTSQYGRNVFLNPTYQQDKGTGDLSAGFEFDLCQIKTWLAEVLKDMYYDAEDKLWLTAIRLQYIKNMKDVHEIYNI